MEKFEVTRLGERGQIVIPQEFRKSMGLHIGEKFIVFEHRDVLMFKRMKAPTLEDFEFMLRRSHEHAEKHRLTEKDLKESIKRARKSKHSPRGPASTERD